MKKICFYFFVILALTVCSCSSNDDSIDNGNGGNPDPNPTPTTYQLGGIGPGGGRIFYLETNLEHGLETSGVITQAEWGYSSIPYPQNQSAVPNLSETLGSGLDNTNKIVDFIGDNNGVPYAAKICQDLVLNGKDDWYLPSKAELNKLFNYYKYENPSVADFGVSETSWSSSQYVGTSSSQTTHVFGIDWVIPMIGGYVHGNYYSPYDNYLTVRAVRSF